MKRIQSACLNQTIHFQLKDDLEHGQAVKEVKAEYEKYKEHMTRGGRQFKIVGETTQDDGSILVRVKKQVGDYSVGDYLD